MAPAAILYGDPAPGLIDIPDGALQTSPLIPGSHPIEAIADGSVDQSVILAPGGALERGTILAHGLRILRSGGRLSVLAPKDKGGSRLRKSLESFGCVVEEEARRHHRFCYARRPDTPVGLDAAIMAGAPRRLPDLGFWSQPGVFSWDRIDPGSAELIAALPPMRGRGADLGCGIGLIAGHVLSTSPEVTHLVGVDLDRRAVACAEHNLNDPRLQVIWADARRVGDNLADLDFVVMNPPFHDGGAEDRALGVAFIKAASAMLRKGGVCWLVANRHLPYEAGLAEAFAKVTDHSTGRAFKVFEARK